MESGENDTVPQGKMTSTNWRMKMKKEQLSDRRVGTVTAA